MSAIRSCLEGLRADLTSAQGRSGPGSLAAVWTYDETVPAELSARWADADSEGVLVRDFARIMINAGAFVILLAGVAGASAGVGDRAVWAMFAVFAAIALVLGWSSHRRSINRVGAFTAGEIDLIMERRTEVRFDDWDGFIGPDAPREVAGARRADESARSVLALPGWSSEQLAEHRIRLDPAGEAAAIRIAARELYDLRCVLAEEAGTAGDGSFRELDRVRAEWHEQLEVSWSALSDRIAAFYEYVREVIDVAVLIDKSNKAQQLAASLDAHGPGLSVGMVTNEMAASHLQDLRSELRAVQLGSRGQGTVDSDLGPN